MKKIIVVVGPTASGKTKLSIELAKHFNSSIISADSVAVYKELNIGSAKPTLEEMQGIKHHLIDIIDADQDYSVADCQRMARSIIDGETLSIICGGTGLYVGAIINNYEFTNQKRDSKFAEQFKAFSNEELYKLLLSKDEIKAQVIHPNNRTRVLRALEAVMVDGKPLSENKLKHEAIYDAYIIYLDVEREILYDRINRRVDEMIAAGLEAEVRSLAKKNIYPKAIGYQEWLPYFRGEITKETVIEEIKKNTRHLAKRQKTWFKNQTNAHFYKVDYDKFPELINQVIQDIEDFLQ